MALRLIISKFSDLRKRSSAEVFAVAEPQEERKRWSLHNRVPRAQAPGRRAFAPEIGSFRLLLAAKGKAAKTVRTYVEAAAWFAAAYASNQFRALQQFFRWLADEEQIPDPMSGLRAPKVTDKLVPVFTSEELSNLAKACQGRSFAQRRDVATSRCLPQQVSGRRSWPGSATTRTTLAAAMSICGPGRSRWRQGRQSASRSDQPRDSPGPGSVSAGALATCPGVAA